MWGASVWGKHDTDLMQTVVKNSKPLKYIGFNVKGTELNKSQELWFGGLYT